MVADQVSRHKCAFCSCETLIPQGVPACASCGVPQPVGLRENFFYTFGLKPRFKVDVAAMTRKFYELSRALHPDRFAQADAKIREASAERMGFINQAFDTLKNPGKCREYILKLAGLTEENQAGAKAKANALPMELAEEWFELQEVFMEGPEQAQAAVRQFGERLTAHRSKILSQMENLEEQFDRDPNFETQRPVLEKIARLAMDLNYQNSLERDFERLKAKLTGPNRG